MECLEGGFPEPFSERRHLRRQAFEGTVDMKIRAMNKTKSSHDILLPCWILAFGRSAKMAGEPPVANCNAFILRANGYSAQRAIAR